MVARRPRWITRAAITVIAIPALFTAAAQTPAADNRPAAVKVHPLHGLVGATCDGQRVAAERAAGITVVVLGASWDSLMPTATTIDAGYRAQLATALRACAAAGMQVVLDAGIQYVPAWVRQLSDASLLDQYGNAPTTNQLDLVFSAAVRSAVLRYIKTLVASLPAYSVSAIRVGTSTSGEMGLPGGNDGGAGHSDSWWAFGAAPQTGIGLAPGERRSPMPGWIPGQQSWHDRAVTAADALSWWRWYEQSMLQAELFLAVAVKEAGFTGAIHFPAAGRGVLPAELTAATASLLAGASQQDDAFARGLDYVDQMPLLGSALPGSVIDLTSVDDATAVTARAASPAQDECSADDAYTSTQPDAPVETWSNLRFARAQVARAGLAAVGENPGPPGPLTGGVANSDPESTQLALAPGYARSCGLAALLFAFEDDLVDGRSGVSLSRYAAGW